MINLKDYQYHKYPTEDELFEQVSDYEIFRYYVGDFVIGKAISSPLRDDTRPSFGIFQSSKSGKLLFKDFGLDETGGAVRFVQLLYDLTWKEAMDLIMIDFGLSRNTVAPRLHNKPKPKRYSREEMLVKSKQTLGYKTRAWNGWDKHYWRDKYGISKKLLEEYDVSPLEYIFFGDNIIKADRLAYVYKEYKDGEHRFKIYQPESKNIKWLNNYVKGTLAGYRQLPETGDLLFIASSLKDGLVLKSLGYDFIAPQTEGYSFKPSVMDELKSRFKQIVVLYDSDDAGISAAHKLKKEFGLEIMFPDDFIKDISDYRAIKGKESTVNFIKDELRKLKDKRANPESGYSL